MGTVVESEWGAVCSGAGFQAAGAVTRMEQGSLSWCTLKVDKTLASALVICPALPRYRVGTGVVFDSRAFELVSRKESVAGRCCLRRRVRQACLKTVKKENPKPLVDKVARPTRR